MRLYQPPMIRQLFPTLVYDAALGDDSTLLGAAENAFAPLLDDPLGVIAAGRGTRLAGAAVGVLPSPRR